MQRFLLVLTLMILPFGLFASNDDLSKSKGTEQAAIVSLSPAPEQTDVSRSVKIEAAFSVPLDPSSVQKNNVKLTFLSSQTNDHIDGDLNYVEEENKVTYTPNSLLEPGMYEIEIKSLKPTMAHKTTTIKEIKYRFIVVPEVLENIVISPNTIEIKEGATVQLSATGQYDNGKEKNLTAQVEWSAGDGHVAGIDANGTLTALKEGMTTLAATINGIDGNASLMVYKEIHGHRLPPEPDPAVNNSTLLGIDSNDNGVRDDVERWIYETYDHPIERGLFMQLARAYQIVIVDPSKAHENIKYIDDEYSCEKYWKSQDQYLKNKYEYKYFDEELDKQQFNTIDRHIAYKRYNAEFSGEVFGTTPASRDKCAFDANGFFKD